jgi:hypothetical protein
MFPFLDAFFIYILFSMVTMDLKSACVFELLKSFT